MKELTLVENSDRSTRRRFLATSAGGAVAVIGTAAAASNGGSRPDGSGLASYPIPGADYPNRMLPWGDPFKRPISGNLVRITRGEVEISSDGNSQVYLIAPHASIYTDEGNDISNFFPGELVCLEGENDLNGEFHATAVWSLVTTIATRVLRVDNNVLFTTNGKIAISPRTRFLHLAQEMKFDPRRISADMPVLIEMRTGLEREPIASALRTL